MVIVFLITCSMNVDAGSDFLDTERINDGVIGIEYLKEDGTFYKVAISKGSQRYYYDYSALKKEYFPLQYSSGEYEVSIYEKIYGTTYKLVAKRVIVADLIDENSVFLQSVQNINWNFDMTAISLAAELAEGLPTANEKVKAVYNYIVASIDYDYEKAKNLDKLYIPDIEAVLESGKGICYDYSSLFASMLRSLGIPAKLIMGYSKNVKGYHAWNEVYIDGKWIVFDTTNDAVLANLATLVVSEKTPLIRKNAEDYTMEKFY
jgi:transglutaminase-like putative cysteine protease